MRRLTIVVAVLALAAVPALAQSTKSTVVNTVHDTTKHGETVANTCTGCHTPHINNTSAIGILFWAREDLATAVTYNVYSAPLTTTEQAINKPLAGASDVEWYSYLCMTCHDTAGSTATNFLNTTNLKFPHNLSGGGGIDRTHFGATTLQTDHPVNFSFDNAVYTVGAGYKATTGTAHPGGANKIGALPLFDDTQATPRTKTVQCATCHDVHAANYAYTGQATGSAGTTPIAGRTFFLRVPSPGNVCLECHN